MKKVFMSFLVMFVLAVFCGSSQAGFTEITMSLSLDHSQLPIPDHVNIPVHFGDISWSFTIPPEAQGNAYLHLSERLSRNLPDWITLVISGETDSDPVMHMTKTVTNETDEVWTAYEIGLAGTGVQFVAGTASSDVFGSADEEPYLLTYQSPDCLAPGETVTFEFDILVETIGDFSFSLSQNPIPEPATIILLGIGAVLLRKRS